MIFQVWHFALDESLPDAAAQCQSFFSANFLPCVQQPSWLKLRRDALKQLLQSGQVEEQTKTGPLLLPCFGAVGLLFILREPWFPFPPVAVL